MVKIVSIGSLIYRKGFDLLIEALHLIDLPGLDWSLFIIGEGPDKQKLERLISQYQLSDKIHLIGRKDKTQIRSIFHQSDIFALSSRSETFGVVYIEAMACGLPVIATNCGGPEEFVTPDVGVVVEIENVQALSSAIKKMLLHYRDFDKQHIIDFCRDNFSAKSISQKYIAEYKLIINQ